MSVAAGVVKVDAGLVLTERNYREWAENFSIYLKGEVPSIAMHVITGQVNNAYLAIRNSCMFEVKTGGWKSSLSSGLSSSSSLTEDVSSGGTSGSSDGVIYKQDYTGGSVGPFSKTHPATLFKPIKLKDDINAQKLVMNDTMEWIKRVSQGLLVVL